jgi:tripartite-type tricarboxylate transporter receptor subunit TctC
VTWTYEEERVLGRIEGSVMGVEFELATEAEYSLSSNGTTALLPDLLAGRVTMSFANIVNAAPLIREGKLRAFAVTSLKRSAVAPDLPTMAESGYPGFEAVPWFGLMAPAGTPAPVVDKLHKETVRIMALPDVKGKLEGLGVQLVGNTPAQFAEIVRSELPAWGKVIKEAGIKLSE